MTTRDRLGGGLAIDREARAPAALQAALAAEVDELLGRARSQRVGQFRYRPGSAARDGDRRPQRCSAPAEEATTLATTPSRETSTPR
jgi:hypothetical protein